MLDVFKSTAVFRYTQRANGAQEVAVSILQSLGITAMLPVKVAQAITAGVAFTDKKLKTHEKVIIALQGSLAATQTGLIISAMAFRESCDCATVHDLCLAVTVCELVFQGTLLLTWVPSELNKERCPERSGGAHGGLSRVDHPAVIEDGDAPRSQRTGSDAPLMEIPEYSPREARMSRSV